MDETYNESFRRWSAEADAKRHQREAEQAFVNQMIDCVYEIGAFDSSPHEDELYEIVRLAVRMAHTCYKQDAKPPMQGYGVKTAFLQAVRRYGELRAGNK